MNKMQTDTLAYYLAALIISALMACQTCAFVTKPSSGLAAGSSATATGSHSATGNAIKDAAEMYALTRAQFMDSVPSGKVSFKPHDLEGLQERAVYDPGDVLLRALNADIAANGQELGTLPMEPDYADTVYNELELASRFDVMRKLEQDIQEEQDMVSKSALLMKMLEDPTVDSLPIVYVEEDPQIAGSNDNNLEFESNTNGMSKRSRYYRRYPWKRHNRNRSTYEPELRYACTPTKEDVFKLLLNLHEDRNGKNGKTINFCNRKRPAKAIFTNIRFLG
ncbi:uncharacterized protein LOC106085677 [Stomoxys calcitrans]|uniref:uncharacterized protein LOC106085677 n=1 Tax=Stomoxys calcitrans TaxID=35570 RepID=UPI0027E325FF|nr:uncharacterized protein LOC106085677 [Stomoxys calcitrans]